MASNNNSSVVPLILGPQGTPAQLRPSQRTEELLGAYDSYLAASFKIPPFNPDTLLASKGYQILDQMMTLTAVRSPVNIVRQAALYKGVTVEAAISDNADPRYTEAAAIADAFRYAIDNIRDEQDNEQDFTEVLFELAYAVHTGFRVTEINWRYIEEGDYKGKYGFRNFAAKPCRQIGFDLDDQTLAVRNITSYTPLDGYDFRIPVEKVLRYTFQSMDSLPFGMGLGRVAYKHYWSIDFLYRFWNIALEQFGTPFILGHASPVGNAMALARQVLAQVRQGAPPVLPTGVEAEVIEIAGTGIAAYLAAVQHHAEELGRLYLNSTLTSSTSTQGTNTNALGNVHQDTSEYCLGSVRRDLENVINKQLVRRWVRYNYGDSSLALAPKINLGDWDTTDTAKLAKAYSQLITSGVVHESEPQLREKIKFGPASPEVRALLDARSSKRDSAATVVQPVPASDPGDGNSGDGNADGEDGGEKDTNQ